MPIRLVLADDHPLLLQGLISFLSTEHDFEVVASCTSGEEALKAVRKHQPDILVLDIKMPGKDGLQVLQEIQSSANPVKVVILTGEITEDETVKSMRLGAKGLVLKELAPQLLAQCLRKVYAGGRWFERNSLDQAMEKGVRYSKAIEEVSEILTDREVEIVRMVARGHRNNQIADKLCISDGTVKRHLFNIFNKLHLESRAELILYAQKKGLI
jgi:DNA-binding NarL/FixJ family response regulator